MLDIGTKSDNTAGASGELTAAEFNDHNVELQGAVEASGQILSASTFLQLAKALFINGVSAQTVVDSGSANSVILSPLTGGSGLQVPDNYAELNGAILRFNKSAPNTTTAVTVNFGQTGTELSAKSLKRTDGSDPGIGDVSGVCLVEWDGSNDWWVLLDNGGSTFIIPVSNGGTVTPVFKGNTIVADTSVGDINFTLNPTTFNGQNIHIVAEGSGTAHELNNNIYITENTDGARGNSINGTIKWENNITANNIEGDFNLRSTPVGELYTRITKSAGVTSIFTAPIYSTAALPVVFPTAYISTPVLITNNAEGSDYSWLGTLLGSTTGQTIIGLTFQNGINLILEAEWRGSYK